MSAAGGPRLVLFDLDGTLADTAGDLVAAINGCLRARGRPERDLAGLRPWISHGARGMVEQAFGLRPGDAGYDEVRAEFVERYAGDLCSHTVLFPGMEATLAAIEGAGLRWGIVTNKIARLTDPLVHQLGLTRRAACVVSGDTAARPKPDPAPIFYALEACGCTPGEGVYVGDDRRDIAAGRAAGVRTYAVSYGYSVLIDAIEEWQADAILYRPQDLLHHVLPGGFP